MNNKKTNKNNEYYSSVTVNGEVVGFRHLQPFTFFIESKLAKKTLRVRVTFSNHCFTKKYEACKHIQGMPIFDSETDRPRSFCPIRYRLSYSLHDIINRLNGPKVKVFETSQERNWCYSIIIDDPSGPYHIFFEVRRPSSHQEKYQDLNLVVESAYNEDPKRGPPVLKGQMMFSLLCGKVYVKQPTSTLR